MEPPGLRIFFPLLISIWNMFGLFSMEKGQVASPSAVWKDRAVLVSCTLEGVDFTRIRQVLEGGDRFTLIYQIEVNRKTKALFDETIRSVEFQKSVFYNNLTQQFYGRLQGPGKNDGEILFANFAEACQWICRMVPGECAVVAHSQPNREYYVRLRIVVDRKRFLFTIPYENATLWKRIPLTSQ